jgi:hypothetical protein
MEGARGQGNRGDGGGKKAGEQGRIARVWSDTSARRISRICMVSSNSHRLGWAEPLHASTPE